MQFKSIYDNCSLCNMFRTICEHKHEHSIQMTDNQIIAHDQEIISRVNNKLVTPRYSKVKGQNVLVFHGKKFIVYDSEGNQTISQNGKVEKYLKRFLPRSLSNSD